MPYAPIEHDEHPKAAEMAAWEASRKASLAADRAANEAQPFIRDTEMEAMSRELKATGSIAPTRPASGEAI